MRRAVVSPILAMMLGVGCAPLASLRPAAPFGEGHDKEIGLGAAAVAPRRYVDEEWLHAGQMWFSVDAKSWLRLSAISAFDAEAVAVGGGATARLVRADRFAGGVEAEVGYGWGALGIPMAVRLFDQTWVYSTPRVSNFGVDPALFIPVGASVHLYGGSFLRLEYQSSWAKFQAYNQRNHFAAGLAVQW
jgi:hypothetical protein